MNALSCGIRMWAQVAFVLSYRQMGGQTDRRTDGQKGLGNTMCCITCSRAVKHATTAVNWFIVECVFIRTVRCVCLRQQQYSGEHYVRGLSVRPSVVRPVASLRWVTPGAATEGVTPLFFPEKPGDLFSRQFFGVP